MDKKEKVTYCLGSHGHCWLWPSKSRCTPPRGAPWFRKTQKGESKLLHSL